MVWFDFYHNKHLYFISLFAFLVLFVFVTWNIHNKRRRARRSAQATTERRVLLRTEVAIIRSGIYRVLARPVGHGLVEWMVPDRFLSSDYLALPYLRIILNFTAEIFG